MEERQGYGATTESHEPGTEHERPEPDEQEEAAGQAPPGGPGFGAERQAAPDSRGEEEAPEGS